MQKRGSVFFGLGLQQQQWDGMYGMLIGPVEGYVPSVDINRNGRVVEVFDYEGELCSITGKVNGMTVNWSKVQKFASLAREPCVALNDDDFVLAMYAGQTSSLYYLVGRWSQNLVYWQPDPPKPIRLDKGIMPAVAMNNEGVAIEVHRSEKNEYLWYHLGQVQNKDVAWGNSARLECYLDGTSTQGEYPDVALNKNNIVVVYRRNSTLYYRTGLVAAPCLFFKERRIDGADGLHFYNRPSVALTDDKMVILVYESNGKLLQRVGYLDDSGEYINWIGSAQEYDSGLAPSVAIADNLAIEVHRDENEWRLCFATSIFTDRATWMSERMFSTLKDRPLHQLVLPASHDAGMYLGGLNTGTLGKTQYLRIYDQLKYGIRWFDLRPARDSSTSKLYIHHGDYVSVNGPALEEVLDDIARYCKDFHEPCELIILKFSHFKSFVWRGDYEMMVEMIRKKLDRWLVWQAPSRLANMTLKQFTDFSYRKDDKRYRTAILVVVDEDYAVQMKNAGFWVYRGSDSKYPGRGDLYVYDTYSNTTDFATMKEDQNKKFKQHKDSTWELYLLSWTLTPATAVWSYAKEANARLGDSIWREIGIPNRAGKIVNMLYVDYCEFARVTDAALVLNGEKVPGS